VTIASFGGENEFRAVWADFSAAAKTPSFHLLTGTVSPISFLTSNSVRRIPRPAACPTQVLFAAPGAARPKFDRLADGREACVLRPRALSSFVNRDRWDLGLTLEAGERVGEKGGFERISRMQIELTRLL